MKDDIPLIFFLFECKRVLPWGNSSAVWNTMVLWKNLFVDIYPQWFPGYRIPKQCSFICICNFFVVVTVFHNLPHDMYISSRILYVQQKKVVFMASCQKKHAINVTKSALYWKDQFRRPFTLNDLPDTSTMCKLHIQADAVKFSALQMGTRVLWCDIAEFWKLLILHCLYY